MNDYTALSQHMIEQALSGSLTVEEACDWLMTTTDFRTLPEKLLRFYGGSAEDFKALMRDELNRLHPDAAERDALRHNLRNWLTPAKGIDNRTISTQYAFEMCFILHFSLETADAFITAVTGEGIHYRSLNEFILSFGLHHQMSYEATMALMARILKALGPFETEDSTPQGYTKLCQEEAASLATEEELQTFVTEHKKVFGTYRSTAYGYFFDMMNVLQQEGTGATAEEIVTQNLYRRFVQKNSRLSEVEKSIRAGWPEKTQLSRMSSRELPVSRKVLILLFLASGGGISEAAQPDEDKLDAWPEEESDELEGDFEALFIQLNAMLTDCGFMPIDPRTPFDWMVLFCMATGDVFDFDDRFAGVLSRLFGNDPQSLPR